MKSFYIKTFFCFYLVLIFNKLVIPQPYDLFPLKVGNYFNYDFIRQEDVYESVLLVQFTIDSGKIKLIIDSLQIKNSDTLQIWVIREISNFKRTIRRVWASDSIILVDINRQFQLKESTTSNHRLTCYPYTELWKFPTETGLEMERFSPDSSSKSFQKSVKNLPFQLYDTLSFHRNIGLVYFKHLTAKGPNTPYYYQIKAKLTDYLVTGQSDYVADDFSLKLFQNYPNPFNSQTKIKYQTAKADRVLLTVYNILGRVVAILVNEHQHPGSYEIALGPNANQNISKLSSGVYFYRLQAGNFSETKKFVLLR